jgi:RHS repeat-associated protein
LKRLTSASSTPINGSTPTGWTQTYQFDGFGNLTAKVLNGTTTPIAVNAATNQLTNAYYDANGNMTSGVGATLTYDEANRMETAQETSGGIEYYGYDSSNKRVYRVTSSGQQQITFYGAHGEKLGVYSVQESNCAYALSCISSLTPLSTSIWFAGRLIMESGNTVAQDRLGTNRASGARFYPYGDEITSTTNDREKFATYTRDSLTGLDYADQRFYASSYGRFNTADQYMASAGPGDPGSWNRYAYTRGDPVNRTDPRGTCDITISGWGFNDGWFPYTDCGASLSSPVDPSYAMFCWFDPACHANAQQQAQGGGGGSAPLPTCTPDQLVGGVIEADAQRIGLNLSGLSASVQLAGAPCTPGTSECGRNGTYTQTELNLTGNLNGLFNQLTMLNGSQFNCNPGSGLLNVLIGPPHNLGPGGTTNCRQVGLTNSLQVNVNVANGTAQLDIDPYNPAALFGLGGILHGIFQVLPNTINGTDSNYASIAQALNISLNCQP